MHANPQRAVSPVVGTAVLLTITILLAAAILAMATGAAGGLSTTGPWDGPDAEFQIDQNGHYVIISHAGGQSLETDSLRVTGVADQWGGDTVDEGDELRTTATDDRVAVVYDGPAGEETLAETRLSA